MTVPSDRAVVHSDTAHYARIVPIVLADDHTVWRTGMKNMLAGTEFVVVGEASSGRECVDVVERECPRIVILDIRVADSDDFDALAELKRRYPRVAVLLLTIYNDPILMTRAVARGAAGFLMKGVTRSQMISTLRAVAHGEIMLTREDLAHCLQDLGGPPHGTQQLKEPLTPREVAVLGLLARGRTNHDIAEALEICEETAKRHVENIIRKLEVSDRVQAAVWAARNGISYH